MLEQLNRVKTDHGFHRIFNALADEIGLCERMPDGTWEMLLYGREATIYKDYCTANDAIKSLAYAGRPC